MTIASTSAEERNPHQVLSERDAANVRSEYCTIRWHVTQTYANHEKRVADHLSMRQITNFVPLYESVRQWKDRRVMLRLPLFPGYIFTRIEWQSRLRVLQVPGVARLVEFGGIPAALPEDEIDALRLGLRSGLRISPHPYLTVGRRVRIVHGPLAGLDGILSRWKGRCRVVLSLDAIQRSVAVDVDVCAVEPIFG